MLIARVIIEHPVASLDLPFDYEIPFGLKAKVGSRVNIEFGHQVIVGYVLEIKETSKTKKEIEKEQGFELKRIASLIDDEAILNKELRELASYMAYNYVSPLISCLQTMLPPSLKPNSAKKVGIKTQRYIKVIDDSNLNLTPKQTLALASLKLNETYPKKDCGISEAILKKLEEAKKIISYDQEIYRSPFDKDYLHKKGPILNDEQNKVIEEIKNGKDNDVYLLQGVTGSGKTEVYIRLADYYLKQGKNVLILVPEISLTPQMVERFKSRLDYPIAVFHSGLNAGKRYDEYRRIARNEVRLVIGARSAVFVPLSNIGLIVIDEEHSESYKQENSPCYNAKDIVFYRAKKHNAKIVLGSATPSLESKARAMKGVYKLVSLNSRVNNASLPSASIVDLGKEIRSGNRGLISKELHNAIKEALDKNEQVVLLLNKRGYAPSVTCPKCGHVYTCPNCGVPLKYHKDSNKLVCHYCDYAEEYPNSCKECGYDHLRKLGYGTQKIEEQLQQDFSGIRVARMDLDSVRMQKGYQVILDGIENHEYDVLLGTQMIAKGLDFPNITLVGVLNADVGLFNGDFRANESSFQLLTQVLGRAGRGEKVGKAIIQTFNPNHFVIRLAAMQDYEKFYKNEMQYRYLQKYPPYRYLSLIMLSGKNNDAIEKIGFEIKKYILGHSNKDAKVLGPSIPYIPKFNSLNRMRLIYWYKDKDEALKVLNEVKKLYSDSKQVKISFDIDPISDV